LYAKSKYEPAEFDKEVKLLLRKIELGMQDPQYIPACERWVRDFVPTNKAVYDKTLYTIRETIHERHKEDTDHPTYTKFKEDYPKELIQEMYKQYKSKPSALYQSIQ
jgi:hypothetical protein